MRHLKSSTLSALGILAFILASASCARAQEDGARPDTTTFTESLLASFTGNSGTDPGTTPEYANLIQASDGNFYGTTYAGGANNDGVAFKITPSGAYTELHAFAGGTTDGSHVYAGLIEGTDGNFYGTTYAGGTGNLGTIFKMTPGGAVTLLHSFAGGATDGSSPYAALVQGTDGNLYGTTLLGGASSDGTVFKITPAGSFTLMHSFAGGASDGQSPYCALLEGTDGNFYGTTFLGGSTSSGPFSQSYGTIYKISPSSPYTVTLLHVFTSSGSSHPAAALVQGTDGNFYGTTLSGATDGSSFKISSASPYSLTTLNNFSTTASGETPYASMIEATDGNFYGTTELGGNSSLGTVFQVTSGGAEAVKYSFAGGTGDGAEPYGGLVQGSDGNFYGMGRIYGANSDGTIYKVTVTPALNPPVSLMATPSTVAPGGSFTLAYSVYNSYVGTVNGTMNQCFATNNAGDTTGWTGILTGTPTTQNSGNLTASSTPGTYTYALTCGGVETGIASVVVEAADATSTVVSTNPSTIAPTGSATVTATVTDTTTPADTPAGTLTFKVGGTTLGSCTLSSGTCSITVSGASLANGSNTITATYSPSSGWAVSNGTTTVTVTSNIVTFTSVTHNFGSEPVGTAAAAFGIAVKNTSTTTAYPYSLNFTPANGFTSATNCPASLAAGASCELVFYFTPTAVGTVTATWSLNPVSGFAYSASNGGTLTGTGISVGAVTLTTAGHNFGTQTIGTTSAAYGTELSNSTSSTENITLGPVPSGPFTMLTNCGTQLAAGASCEIEFTFTPTSNSTVQVVVPLSGTPTAITAGGAALPSGGITLSGN